MRLAQVYCRTCRLKMAREVSDLIHEKLREEVNKVSDELINMMSYQSVNKSLYCSAEQ